ncbi:hypothetical protein ACFE04_022928 [Oxalis oulophora]
MPPPPPPTAATYTTIPISFTAVISRSIENLTTTVSLHRPWPEFIQSESFTRPDSLPSALTRVKRNLLYFTINYSLIIAACGLLSIIGSPLPLILFAAIVFLWVVLHFFREDPVVLREYQVNDKVVLLGLVVVSVMWVLFSGVFWSWVLGIVTGGLIILAHGVFRNPDGLFVDEEEAVHSGLMASTTGWASLEAPTSNKKKVEIVEKSAFDLIEIYKSSNVEDLMMIVKLVL